MNSNRAQHVHKKWTVAVAIDEQGAETRASDRYFAAIGDELAAARALFDAAQQVMAVTEDDIENITDEPVRFRRWDGAGLSIGAEQ
jgi:hypothetical protein